MLTRRHLLTLAAASPLLRSATTLKVGMIPDAGATQVAIDEKAPLRDYLAKALRQPVSLIIPTNYNATVEALGNSSLDFAYLGALTYVKAHAQYGVVPLVQRATDKQFHSLFITQSGSKIQTLADLRNKSFAYGDINSTSGHLIPYSELKQAGIPESELQSRYTGSHAATLKAVESGSVAAGALDETVYRAMTSDGKADPSKLRIFHTSAPFVDYVWVARKDLDAAHRESFSQAFLTLKEGKDDAILTILRGKSFVRVEDKEYENIVSIARQLKML